jgi:hypothetical protein
MMYRFIACCGIVKVRRCGKCTHNKLDIHCIIPSKFNFISQ